eukprot:1446386-Amphidinium_carterae.1
MDDLLASGQISGSRYCTLVNDAYHAGLLECYSAAAQGEYPTLQKILKGLVKGTQWPKPRNFNVPLLARDQTRM